MQVSNPLTMALILMFCSSCSISSKEDSETLDPIKWIKVSSKAPKCGLQGTTPYIESKSSNRDIVVVIHVKFKYQAGNRDDYVGTWTLSPKQTIVLGSYCTIPGPTKQKFTFYAKSAEWAD
ncbi:hypothetical protein IC830_06180 [Vibrio parahaemolyticus]|nr:hypothetical protein IC830_06180 [Vibrio parahaemolyticus]